VPPPSISAVSEAGAPAGDDADGLGDGDEEAVGDGETEGDGEAEGVDEADAEGDGDALGGAELPEACPTTSWPAAIDAEPVSTSVREPTAGGAGAGTGAGCPLRAPRVRRARVAEAGT
jgi:hypothetical protein